MNKKLLRVLAILVQSDFKSVEKKFTDQHISKEDVKKYLSTFKDLRDKQKIKEVTEKNIDYWGKKSFEEFKSFVDKLVKTSSKTSIKKDTHKKHEVDGAEFITENEDWLVYKINTYKASKLLGSRDWCIVRSEEDFESHKRLLGCMTFYYILSKTRDKEDEWYKIALGVAEGKKLYWDNFDKPSGGASSIPLKKLKIPTFKAKHEFSIDIEGTKYTEQEFIAVKDLKVGGDLSLRGTPITSLPEGLTVGRSLDLRDTKITSLPKGLTVGRGLYLSLTEITSLPEGLTVGGGLYLRDTKITSLPEGLKVGGGLDLSYTKITSLPEGLKVGGSLDLYGTQITSLPEGLTVGRDLNLRNTPITSLPEGLTVGGSLDLEGTQITFLPEGLSVGGDLDLRRTKITSLPDGLKVGNTILLRQNQKIKCNETLRNKLRS